MQKNLESLPQGPYLLPRFNPGQGGVDFLGLRQVNLDLMAECIPGINNVTHRIRPYSVMCWIYWKFYRMMQEKAVHSPSEAEMLQFKEKVETLFLWGHQLAKLRGIPGFLAGPTQFRGGKAELSFQSWNRDARNTSLQAAVQYGPSLSDRGGLGFLHKVESSFYQTTARGAALAKALDERLRKRQSYGGLVDLRSTHASEDDAKDLFIAWRSDEAGADERATFRESFLKESGTDGDDAIGRRSAIICLIREILRKSRRMLTQEEIRKSMAYGRLPTDKRFDVSGGLHRASKKWLLLQVRQAQRIALESLLAWVEHRILHIGERDARQFTSAAVGNLRKETSEAFQKKLPAEILAGWVGRLKTLDDYVRVALNDESRFCMFRLGEELEMAVRGNPDGICVPAFKLLMLARCFYQWLGTDEEILPYLEHGGSERISLRFWAKTWDTNSKYPLVDLVALVLNNMVLSQHFAVATNRFDGGTQRLRITIEEDGLEALVSRPWRPDITPDRLGTTLSLMVDCNLIKRDASKAGYSA